ncbi:cytochrome c maturation protein CcmE [Rubrivirga sp.]|uniref:cytochrome c maturation protein CcmE domain-containing protein n=1 Tax=Rubrivirga sp. TaxID=1885344 RepID=UPI003C770CFB
MRPTTLLGIAFVGIFGFLVVTSFGEQVAGWETFEDATVSGRKAHVVGTWVRDAPSSYDPSRNVFTFTMADTAGTVRPVMYSNPKPANFEDAERVVVQGQMAADGSAFQAEHILVKCPSKYNDGREFEDAQPGMPVTTTSSAATGYDQ